MKLAKIVIFAASLMLIALIGSNCAKKSTSPTEGQEPYMGKWNWARSTGGFAGWTLTPESEGYTQALEFSGDGMYHFYRDGLTLNKGRYTVTWEETTWLPDSGYVVRYDDSDIEQIIMWHADTLELVDICYDCFWHVYLRAK